MSKCKKDATFEEVLIIQQPFSEDIKDWIIQGLIDHANIATGYNEKYKTTAFIAKAENSLLGGIVLEIFWGGLNIKYLYVEECFRRKRIGSRLLEIAFAYGRKNHCFFALVTTMNFQALEFYEKFGFKIEFTRSGFAHGAYIHYMRKDFGLPN